MDPGPTAESPWRRRGRRVANVVIGVELVGLALFLGAIFAAESSRFSLIALYLPRQPLIVAALVATLLAPLARRSRVLVPLQLGVCLVVLFPGMGLTCSAPRHAERPIHLATYNVYFGKGGRPQLEDEIAAMQADIVVMQAAFESLGGRLRERFPDRTIHQDHELVMMTRFSLRSVEVPSALADGTPPMFVKYVIDTPTGAIRLYNVHPFSPRHALLEDDRAESNVAQREAQIAAALDAAKSDVPPFVIAGDTNLPPPSSIARRHFAGVHDAFDDAGLGFGYTFPAKRPWMRIDRALAGDGVRFVDARVGPRGTSDHRPLFVDLELTSER